MDGETVFLAVDLPARLARDMGRFKERFKATAGAMTDKEVDKRHGWQRYK